MPFNVFTERKEVGMGDEEDGDEEVDGMSRVGMGKGAEVEVESGDDSRSKAEICRSGDGG